MDPDDQAPASIDSYSYAMARARRNRQQRATETGTAVLHYLWPQLARRPQPAPQASQHDPRWELRGQPRTRETFAHPHPGDFPGGLPIPPEYS